MLVIYVVKYKTFLSGLFQDRELKSMHHELDVKQNSCACLTNSTNFLPGAATSLLSNGI